MVFVGVSNLGSGGHSSHDITYHPYGDNAKLQNAINETDRVFVSNGKFQVNIWNGQPKLYIPCLRQLSYISLLNRLVCIVLRTTKFVLPSTFPFIDSHNSYSNCNPSPISANTVEVSFACSLGSLTNNELWKLKYFMLELFGMIHMCVVYF